ncbi:MAG: hypothetical protein JNN32_03310 [Flavobacteriales bacterium]|nr:hypothetical protein [Flavobacteriales bacterium]
MSGLKYHISLVAIILCCAWALPVHGQPDVLTDEFSKLSAKERARIAKEEEQNAATDAPFQALMASAEELFRAKDFDGALERYKEARARRPLNVYPKVKIQDLQALIAKRDAEQAAAPPVEPLVEVPPSAPEPARPVPAVVDVRSDPVTPPIAQQELPKPEVRVTPPEPPPPVITPPKADPRPAKATKPAAELKVGERVYKEGRSVVVETVTPEDGRAVVYKKVSHPWGDENYFREGLPISERAYRVALGK